MASFNDPKVTNSILSDVNALRALIRSLATMNPASGNTDMPEGSIQFISTSEGMQFRQYNGSAWSTITSKLMHDVDKLDGYDASKTSTAENIIPVYKTGGLIAGGCEGNAGTASKLKTPVNIDIGGYISGTAVQFDGSKDITLNVNRIDVNNDSDNVLNGIISKAHGGTGRDDGAASDIILSNGGKASDYGQIGTAKNVTGTDINTLVVSGNYISNGGTIALHYPKDSSDIFRISVSSQGTYVKQIIHSGSEVWVRDSKDTGASWCALQCIGASNPISLIIYISKSGSDSNTGLDMANPVLTINRALAIAKNLAPTNSGTVVEFRVGEGDWGSVSFNRLPYILQIFSYSGNTATEYVETLPRFTGITSYGSYIRLGSLVCDTIDAMHTGCIYITSNYIRFSTLRSRNFGLILAEGNETNSYPTDIKSKDSHDFVYQAYGKGNIVYTSNRVVRVIENINLSGAFMNTNNSGSIAFTNTDVVVNEGVSVTGKKYIINNSTEVSRVNLDSLPGSVAGTKYAGAIINGIPYGGGMSDSALMADMTWKPVLLQTGGTINGSIEFSSGSGVYNSLVEKGTIPSQDLYTNIQILDKNGYSSQSNRLGLVETTVDTNGRTTTSLAAYRFLKGSTSRTTLQIICNADGTGYATAPSPSDNANGTEIATTYWANKNIENKLANYLPLSGGAITGGYLIFKYPGTSTDFGRIVVVNNATHGKQFLIDTYNDNDYGAYLSLYKGADTNRAGGFVLATRTWNANTTRALEGFVDGRLIWNGANVVRSVNNISADSKGNVTLNITGTKVNNAAHADSVTTACYRPKYSIPSPDKTQTQFLVKSPGWGTTWFVIGHATIGSSRDGAVKTYNIKGRFIGPNQYIINDTVTSDWASPGWRVENASLVCIRLN